jgi:hypothetical protein
LDQAWRERVFPLLREHLARRVDSAISWSLLFHETALANLLEVGLPRDRGSHASRMDCRAALQLDRAILSTAAAT